jgi:hypothetical protein
MQRYFFDVAARTYVQYDYHGREIHKPEQARELAELIALDIECTDGDDLVGAEIQVRNVSGQQLYSVPIRELKPSAA